MNVYVKLEDPERVYTIQLSKFLSLANIEMTEQEIAEVVRRVLISQ